MKKIYIYTFLALIVSSCCSTLISNTEKCKCKEFEQYVKSWKVEQERNTLYIDRAAKDEDSWKYFQEYFINRLDCLKGKTFGDVKKLFKMELSETNITIPTNRECLDCYLNRNDCRGNVFERNSCKHLEIALGRDNEATVKDVRSSLQTIGYLIHLSK